MGCLKLTYKRNNATLKVAYSLYRENKKYCTGSYSYGFNGQEKDDEIYREGGALSYLYRIQDTRLGRFLSVDPLTKSYPWLSPYAFAANRPIDGRDLEGREWDQSTDGNGNTNISANIVTENATTLSRDEMSKYYSAANDLFNQVLSTSSDGKVTGKLSFGNESTNSNQITPSLLVQQKPYAANACDGLVVAAQTTWNSIDVNIYDKNNNIKSPQEFAEDFVHELFHTLKLAHPFETTQAEDASLQHAFGNQFVTTPTTDPNIVFNIMNYGSIDINNKNLGELWKQMTGQRVTAGQIEFMINQINTQKDGINIYLYYNQSFEFPGKPVEKTGN